MRRVRHPILLLVVAVLLVAVLESLFFTGPVPLVSRLDAKDRVEFYKQVTMVTASLLGFIVAAVAILVTLDIKRPIVEQLRRGESFSLLITNLLAAILFLFLTTIAGVVGAVADDGSGAGLFESVYEAILLASIFELILGGFYFGLVTYKVAKYD